MNRERALKIVLVLVGLLFLALIYPLVLFVREDPSLSMMFNLYVTLGIFLWLLYATIGQSYSDRLHCVVKPCSRGRNRLSSITKHRFTPGTGRGRGPPTYRRCVHCTRAAKAQKPDFNSSVAFSQRTEPSGCGPRTYGSSC